MPRSGERTMKTSVFTRPVRHEDAGPAFTTAAPANPPMRACEEEDGRPHHHVRRFQTIAPTSAARMRTGSTTAGFTMSLPIVLATRVSSENAATKLKKAAHDDRDLRRQDARPDDGRDGVRRVVEAVDEVEGERDERRRRERRSSARREAQEDFRTICSRTFATSSQRSVASSRTS